MKVGFVSSRKGQITAIISESVPYYIMVTMDAGIPQIPQISLRIPMDPEVEANTRAVIKLGVEAILDEMASTLIGFKFSRDVVEQFYVNVLKELMKAEFVGGGNSDGERSGSSDPVLTKILEDENEKIYEIDFDLPDGFVGQVHDKIVTAGANTYVRTDRVAPYKRELGIEFSETKIPSNIDPKKIIKKYRNNIYKHTPSKNYVLVYDINGRPTGMMEAPKGPMKWNKR